MESSDVALDKKKKQMLISKKKNIYIWKLSKKIN